MASIFATISDGLDVIGLGTNTFGDVGVLADVLWEAEVLNTVFFRFPTDDV